MAMVGVARSRLTPFARVLMSALIVAIAASGWLVAWRTHGQLLAFKKQASETQAQVFALAAENANRCGILADSVLRPDGWSPPPTQAMARASLEIQGRLTAGLQPGPLLDFYTAQVALCGMALAPEGRVLDFERDLAERRRELAGLEAKARASLGLGAVVPVRPEHMWDIEKARLEEDQGEEEGVEEE